MSTPHDDSRAYGSDAPRTSPPPDDARRWQQPRQPGYAEPDAAPTEYSQTGYSPSDSAATTQSYPPYGEPPREHGSAEAPRRNTGLVVGTLLGAVLLGGVAGLGGGALFAAQDQPRTVAATTSGDALQESAGALGTIADVAEAAGPAVVTVQAVSNAGAGEGSGVAVAAGGYIVTNNHVVTLDGQTADASITVETNDGRLLVGEIVGTDPTVDLAVIRVEEDLPIVTIASSDDVRVGDTAIAIGAPLGLSNSVTNGIVSAVDRGLRIASTEAPSDDETQQSPFGFWREDGTRAAPEDISVPVVQTDASINPGNSGGALLNASGQLIGVNVAIASMGDGAAAGSIGIGFAIESSVVQRVVEEIIAEGSASHGLLGAAVTDVRDAAIGTVGAQIREVVPGGPAESAGLQPGDVITAIDGAPVTNAVDATAQVRAYPAGATVTVEYLRNGEVAETEVTLAALE